MTHHVIAGPYSENNQKRNIMLGRDGPSMALRAAQQLQFRGNSYESRRRTKSIGGGSGDESNPSGDNPSGGARIREVTPNLAQPQGGPREVRHPENSTPLEGELKWKQTSN
jgi:hypothetical protein